MSNANSAAAARAGRNAMACRNARWTHLYSDKEATVRVAAAAACEALQGLAAAAAERMAAAAFREAHCATMNGDARAFRLYLEAESASKWATRAVAW